MTIATIAATTPAKAFDPRTHSYLAHRYLGELRPLQVLRSAAGWYIGAADELDGPLTRDSEEYFPSHEAAERALATGAWTQRDNP